ncbi:MAG: InlB B-repeat-containing protein [Saccharofermentanales bacterium]
MKYSAKSILCVSLGIVIIFTSITGIPHASPIVNDSLHSSGRIGDNTVYPTDIPEDGNIVGKTLLTTDPGSDSQSPADSSSRYSGSPTVEDIEKYKEDGTLDERAAFMESLQNNKTSPNLIRNLLEYEQKSPLYSQYETQASTLPQGMQTGMSSTGTAQVLVLTVEFNDMKFDSSMSLDSIRDNFFSPEDGSSMSYPYESLSAYYNRSSYGKLNIQGDVLGGCSLPSNRAFYDGNYIQLVLDTITYYDSTGVDFSRYDGNGDGAIDSIYFYFAGGNSGWGSTWWSYTSYYFVSSNFYAIDQTKLSAIVMLHDDSTSIAIHETGHVLGLPDYYDYVDAGIWFGGNGGSKTDDMMDNNTGDHNGFSKLLLGWIDQIQTVSSGEGNISLRPLGEYGDIAIVFPEHSSLFSEYYLIEYVGKENFDIDKNIINAVSPPSGLRILHVSAQLNSTGTDFVYDNTGTGVKLLEAVNKNYNSEFLSSLFLAGESLTPYTIPSSGGYDYSVDTFNTEDIRTVYSGVSVDQIVCNAAGTYDFSAKILDKPANPVLTFEISSSNPPVANNIMDVDLTASGVFYKTAIKPYIVINNNNIDLMAYTSTYSKAKNRLRLMYWTENGQNALSPNTQYKIVIPQGAYIGENGAANETCEFFITTDGFAQTETLGSTASEWGPVIFERDDGKIVSPNMNTNTNEYKLIVDDIVTFENSVTDLAVPDNETVVAGIVYDNQGIIKLYDGNFAWVRDIGTELNDRIFHITKYDLYGNVLSDIIFSGRVGKFIPFEDGVLLYYCNDFEVVRNCVYIELSSSPAIHNIDLNGLSYGQLGPNSFVMYPIDQRNFMLIENIKNFSESKAYIFDRQGTVIDEFLCGDVWNRTNYIRPFRDVENNYVIFKPVSDVPDDYNNEHQRNILVTTFKNGDRYSDLKLFENDRNIYSFDVDKTHFGYEVIVRYRIQYVKYGFSDTYPIVYFFDDDFNLLTSYATIQNNAEIYPTLIYRENQNPIIVRMQESVREYEIIGNFDVNIIDKPMPDYQVSIASTKYVINESTNKISGIVPGVTTVEDLLNNISGPIGTAKKVVRIATGLAADSSGLVKSYHTFVITSEDGMYSEYYGLDMPRSICEFGDSDMLSAILAVNPPMQFYDIDKDEMISEEELQLITYLTLDFKNITDLTGLERAESLKYLSLNGNQISDLNILNSLSHLTNLYTLNLSNNQISDISILGNLSILKNLYDLRLDNNQISDIRALGNLTNLRYLGLSGNQLSDITTLGGLINLEQLFLLNNQIIDISALSGLNKLEYLHLGYNQISEISSLNSISNLTDLYLSSNQISDISALNSLTTIINMSLSDNRISDISALSRLTRISFLDLSSNQISDISSLSNISNIGYLYLSNNQIADIIPLSGLQNLSYLYLNNNQINDISELSELTNLENLDFSYNQINDIGVLIDLLDLTALNISINLIDLSDGSSQKEVLDSLLSRGVSIYNAGQQQLIGIKINQLPAKLTYELGESLDAGDMKVAAYYNGGYEHSVIDYVISGYDANVGGNQLLTVTYQAHSTTFTVTINADICTVTFNSQGGSAVAVKTADYNTAITAPAAPTRTGYTFGGWYKESGCTNAWNFATYKVTTATTLYAKWTVINYPVTFNSQSGSAVASKTASYNTSVTAPANPTRMGYTFGGWYKESGCINVWSFTNDKITAATTLYARWTIITYIVTFNSMSGSAVTSKTASYNTSVTAPANPTRSGYTFLGWYTSSAYTTQWNFTTNKVTANTTLYARWLASAATGLKAVSAGYNSIKLTWTAVSGASNYEIYRSTSSAGTYALVTTITASAAPSYTNISLSTGTNYYYKVRAYALVGTTKVYSGYSAVVYTKAVPATPTALKAASASYNSIKLTWTAVGGASGYGIYRATSLTGTYTLLTNVTTASYTNTSLPTGTTYYYKVNAYRLVGTTKVYGSQAAAVSAKAVPATPTALKAASASYNSIKLTWTAVSGASGYSIYRATSSAGTYTI